jgi:hypothetical protein
MDESVERGIMIGDVVQVRYIDHSARVTIGDRLLEVERRDDEGRIHSCPIELVTAALGS